MLTADSTWPLPSATAQARSNTALLSLPLFAGLYLSTRISFTYIAFQSDPRLGSAFTLACGLFLLFAACVSAKRSDISRAHLLFANSIGRWLVAYLALVGFSLLWTQADSPAAATSYWLGMCVDVLTILLLASSNGERTLDLLRGFVIGSLLVAVVAWAAPTLPDLRIGNEEFLHPNGLGLQFAIACFIAQFLGARSRVFTIASALLAISLLRTLSKTSILAFVIAECFIFLRYRARPHKRVWPFALLAVVVVVSFWSLLTAYVAVYIAQGDQAATLTGRTAIWITTLDMAQDHLWLGHGLYSFRALMPAFGAFEPWHAHNEALQQLFEFGIAGVLVVAALYFSVLRRARGSADIHWRRLAVSLALFALIHGLTDTVNFGLSLPLWLFAVLAMHLDPAVPSREVSACASLS